MLPSLLQSNLFMPVLQYADTVDVPAGTSFVSPLHNHPDHTELMLICEGEGVLTFDGKTYTVGPHTLLLYNQGIWHDEQSHPHLPFRTLYLGVSGLQLDGLPAGCLIERHRSPVIFINDEYFQIEQRFREVVSEKNSDAPGSADAANHLMMVFLVELTRCIHYKHLKKQNRKDRTAAQTIATAKRFIHQNYNSDITLGDLSRACFISPYHLCRVFKRETGLSPIQYLTSYRIEVTKRYLETTNNTISSIAGSVGFKSDTYFQNLFKKIAGKTPGQYRREADKEPL